MTPAEVLTTIRNQIFDTSSNFWTDAEILSYMTEAQEELAETFDGIEGIDTSINTVAGTQEYAIPSTVYSINYLKWDNVPLKKIDFREMEFQNNGGYGSPSSSGSPTCYYEWAGNIGLYPTPDRIAQLKIYCYKSPVAITPVSTVFEIPKELHKYIADYCLFKMCLKDQEDEKAKYHLSLWRDNITRILSKVSAKKKRNRFSVVKMADSFPKTDIGII